MKLLPILTAIISIIFITIDVQSGIILNPIMIINSILFAGIISLFVTMFVLLQFTK